VDFVGNIGLRLVGLLVTVGILAAVYLFVIRPATDTANNAINSFSEPLKQAEQQAAAAQQQLKQDANNGGLGRKTDLSQLDKLQRCVQKAHQNVEVLQRCAQRFGP
jgi:flagellar hook-basal body complex protein FliE